METAVSGYLDMKKAAWTAVDKCPKPGCNGKNVSIIINADATLNLAQRAQSLIRI